MSFNEIFDLSWTVFFFYNIEKQQDLSVVTTYDTISRYTLLFYKITRGASPRRDAARLGSAHIRNFQGCMTCVMSSNSKYRIIGNSGMYMRQHC